AVAMLPPADDVPAAAIEGEDLLACRIDFKSLVRRSNEGVAVAQPLTGDRLLGLELAEHLALAVALRDASPVHLGDQVAIVADDLHVNRKGQVAELPARLAVAAQFAQLPASLKVLESDQRQPQKRRLLLQPRQIDLRLILLPPPQPGIAGGLTALHGSTERH